MLLLVDSSDEDRLHQIDDYEDEYDDDDDDNEDVMEMNSADD